MDAQLIQAGLSKVEKGRARAKKAYEAMTEEQKAERRAKQAEAARKKRAAKAAEPKPGVGAGGVEAARDRAKKAYATLTEEQKAERRAKQAESKRKKYAADAPKREAERKAASAAAAAAAEEERKKKAEEEAAYEEQQRKRRAEEEAALTNPSPLRREPVIPETPRKGVNALVKKLGWSFITANIKPADDSANRYKDKVYPSQALLVTPDGKTGWWIWSEDIDSKIRQRDAEQMKEWGAPAISLHKFKKEGDIWVEIKPSGHSFGKEPWHNVFYSLHWSRPREVSSYPETTQKYAVNYEYALPA
jgi:hypothetical protein